ncbi:MAG: glycosyltransferase, partial [Pseudomonadota bacterium]
MKFDQLSWRLSLVWRYILGDLSSRAVECIARIPQLRWMPRGMVAAIERTMLRLRAPDLFDPDFYLACNPDVAGEGEDPLRHYLRFGWAEGRKPNPDFDDGFYRTEAGLSVSVPVSPLGHFIAYGQYQGISPRSGASPDPRLSRGLRRGGVPHSADELTEAMRPSLTAARTALAQAVARYDPAQTCGTLKVDSAKVDIVIPVFKGHAETLNTIAHVLAARNTTPMEVVVVNDASPEADLVEDVQCLARDGIITLLSHQENEGFVAATNYGTALHPNRDVIWLNADTEVYDHWIDRLRAVAYEYGRVATVTPLTNNGTICSYPRFNTDNPGKLDVSWAELDADTATLNANVCVKTPTAVGFATYVRRAALDDIGLLDRAAFGLGYGEENDFSQRAILAGWTNLVATNVLVKHYGATSFGDRRSRRVEAALQVLDQRYPAYRSDIQQFLAEDPIFPARRRLDVARLKRLRGRRNLLLISHSLGGGTQQHLEEETKRLSGLGWSVFLMSGGLSGQPMSVMLTH